MSDPQAEIDDAPGEEDSPDVVEASDPVTSPARLRELSEHENDDVRAAVVANASAPDALFADAWKDHADGVRHALVSHRAHLVPEYAYPALANDPATSVRGAALRKLRMPEALLLELARHPDQRVRRSAAKNPGATPDVQRACDAYEAPLKKFASPRPAVGPCAHGALAPIAEGERPKAHSGGGVTLPDGWAWPACRECAAPMLLLLEVELGEVPTWVRPGSRLVFFACRRHDDVPVTVEAQANGQLGPKYWERSDGHHALLLFRPGEATHRHEAQVGLVPKKLELTIADEVLEEVGPLAGRYFVGSQGWKVGGYPSWCQGPVSLTCACGAELGLVAQMPERTSLELADGPGCYTPFLGAEAYLLACTRQCDPNAALLVVQD